MLVNMFYQWSSNQNLKREIINRLFQIGPPSIEHLSSYLIRKLCSMNCMLQHIKSRLTVGEGTLSLYLLNLVYERDAVSIE